MEITFFLFLLLLHLLRMQNTAEKLRTLSSLMGILESLFPCHKLQQTMPVKHFNEAAIIILFLSIIRLLQCFQLLHLLKLHILHFSFNYPCICRSHMLVLRNIWLPKTHKTHNTTLRKNAFNKKHIFRNMERTFQQQKRSSDPSEIKV